MQPATSSPNVAVPRSASSTRSAAVCSATDTGEAWMWSRFTVGGGFGVNTDAAIAANCSGVMPIVISGSSPR